MCLCVCVCATIHTLLHSFHGITMNVRNAAVVNTRLFVVFNLYCFFFEFLVNITYEIIKEITMLRATTECQNIFCFRCNRGTRTNMAHRHCFKQFLDCLTYFFLMSIINSYASSFEAKIILAHCHCPDYATHSKKKNILHKEHCDGRR